LMRNGSASSQVCSNDPPDRGRKCPEGLGAAGAFPRRWRWIAEVVDVSLFVD
jgi:hypothetical protein